MNNLACKSEILKFIFSKKHEVRFVFSRKNIKNEGKLPFGVQFF